MLQSPFALSLTLFVLCGVVGMTSGQPAEAGEESGSKVRRFARFEVGGTAYYGIVEGDQVRQIEGDLFGEWKPGKRTFPLSSVKLLVPVANPSQVLALAGSYKSHLGGANRVTTVTTVTKITTDVNSGETSSNSDTTVETVEPGQIPEKFQIPQVFFKTPSCLIGDGQSIVIPRGTEVVHYEAELVIVIGRKAQHVSEEEARDCILGVTCGNDVSARDWQKNDVQWWRAKGSDTFGPCGPYIASGLDYDNLLVQLRLNGDVKQEENTNQFIHNVPKMVSAISQHVMLYPGDLIFTGTSGRTSEIKPGDTVEVEIEGVGTLTNPVAAASN